MVHETAIHGFPEFPKTFEIMVKYEVTNLIPRSDTTSKQREIRDAVTINFGYLTQPPHNNFDRPYFDLQEHLAGMEARSAVDPKDKELAVDYINALTQAVKGWNTGDLIDKIQNAKDIDNIIKEHLEKEIMNIYNNKAVEHYLSNHDFGSDLSVDSMKTIQMRNRFENKFVKIMRGDKVRTEDLMDFFQTYKEEKPRGKNIYE
ncbi:hypothetical protein GOV05_03370 [Candidatus Woesearchaeota archaeon]|nr:hypothetical protein [Candidatus Woesearchaeota archaeon]